MNSVVINFSGHALCPETESILRNKYGTLVSLEPYEFDFDKAVEPQIEEMISSVPHKLDGTESITIIPPGQSTLAILLVSYLHGISGSFPRICYLELNDKGLYLPKVEYEVNVHKVRSAGRKYRKVLFNT